VSFDSFAKMAQAFLKLGCEQLLIRPLAENQDNEKNQIYLGYNHGFIGLLPGTVSFRGPSGSTRKPGSNSGKSIIETALPFSWINEEEEPALAPHAKIIDYFQYPEMRFSGFMQGCSNPPDALRRNHQDEYGRRVLVLGYTAAAVFGTVITDRKSTFVDQLLALPSWSIHELFKVHPLVKNSLIDPSLLLTELREVGGGRKFKGQKLEALGTKPKPFSGTQAAGWTLESILEIPMNSKSGPDKYGFELKTFLRNKITLMTTEPDFGYRHDDGLTSFLEKYGWDGTKNDGSLRFNGKHNTLRVYEKSKLQLRILNWDKQKNEPDGKGDPNVVLINPLKPNEIAAGWTFNKLAEKWGRKHAGAMYVQATRYETITKRGIPSFTYGPEVHCGRGTSPIYLLRAIASGYIYLDPGDRVYLKVTEDAKNDEKKRTQWRVDKQRGVPLANSLSALYDELKTYQI